jgi:hypothetical protein
MKFLSLHIVRMILVITFSLAPAATHAGAYKWVDEDGRVHYGDSVPPEVAGKERRKIDEQGRTIRVYEAAKTPEQKEEEKRLAAIRAEQSRQARLRAIHDRSLLATYSNENDMIKARDGRLNVVEANIQLTRSRIGYFENYLAALTQEAAEFERSGKRPPASLRERIENARNQIIDHGEFILSKQREKKTIRQQFDSDILRFRELRGQDG